MKNPKDKMWYPGYLARYSRGKKPGRCKSDPLIDGVGFPCEAYKRKRYKPADPDPENGRIVVEIRRHIETLNRLQVIWACTRTEALLRLLRPIYAPVRDAYDKEAKEIVLKRRWYSTDPKDYDEMGELTRKEHEDDDPDPD